MPTVAAHVAAELAAHLDQIFGVMGNGNALLLDSLERRTDITFTAMRHEAGGVAAADAHYRASGRLAAATSTYGAGVTNTLTALAEACQARIPLVLVVGDEPTTGRRPWDVDQATLAATVGARSFTVTPDTASSVTRSAIGYALAARSPVVLAIPYDVAATEIGSLPVSAPISPPAPITPRGEFADALVADVVAALSSAERPLLVAGRGAWIAGAGEALGALAAACGAVTATSALGRGIFPEQRYDLGVVGGFGAPAAMDLIRLADVVVVFGAALNQFTMRFGALFAPGTRVIQIDVATSATHPNVGTFIRGDAAVVASMLADALVSGGSSPSGWRESVDFEPLAIRELGEERAPDGRLDPRAAARRIADLLPEDRVVVSDGGHFIGWANTYWPVASPDRMMMVGTAFQTIGLGWPSVCGAARARPDATVVLTTGDGGGLMALADLESAIRVAGGRGLAVVWNDAAYGAELNLYGLQGLAQGPMRIPEVDFAAVGEAMGAEGLVVDSLAALDRLGAWADSPPDARRFLILDLRISPDVIAPYQKEIIEVNR